jgi:hypothetical protein
MAITYLLHQWGKQQGYLNLDDGVTSRIRIKKLRDGDEIKNLDHNLPTADISNLTDPGFQAIIDALIDRDEAADAAIIERLNRVVPDVDTAKSDSFRRLPLKARVGAEVPART